MLLFTGLFRSTGSLRAPRAVLAGESAAIESNAESSQF
jgi:hypothetical protein